MKLAAKIGLGLIVGSVAAALLFMAVERLT